MMMNLLSIFDPASSLSLSMDWLSMFIFLFMFPCQFWFIESRITYIWNLFISYMFKILINYSSSNIIIFTSTYFIYFFQ